MAAADSRPAGFEATLAARAGKPQTVDLRALKGELRVLPEVEVAEQLRDWGLLAVTAGMGADPAAGLVADLPPALRRPYLASLREFPYGPGRFVTLNRDECLVLVPAVRPKDPQGLRFDRTTVCRLLDARRFRDGKIPATVRVAVYEIVADRKNPSLTVTYISRYNGAGFDTAPYGFVTAKAGTTEQLADFLARTDDLLGVRYDDGIVLTGRKYPDSTYRRPYRRLDVQDIRTVHHAVRALMSDDLPAEVMARLKADPKFVKLDDDDKRTAIDQVKRMFKDEKVMSNAIGFSLDPWLNTTTLTGALQELIQDEDVLSHAENQSLRTELKAVTKAVAETRPFPVPDHSDADPTRLFALMDKLRNPPAPLSGRARSEVKDVLETLEKLADTHQFQAPRYEGNIAGTQVGMTLYYTDLTAKLYAMAAIRTGPGKFESLALPQSDLEPFVPATAVKFAAFYLPEVVNNPYGRLWWGVKTAGFLIDGNAVRFAPVATTLFMKSKPNQTALEVDANIRYATFCAGWNHQFLTIADWNPEYHRLNEVMKWNVALMASDPDQFKRWAFLEQGDPGQLTSFRQWMAGARKDGRVVDRVSLPFLSGVEHAPSDALEKIRSAPFKLGGLPEYTGSLEGGVTGPRIGEVRSRMLPEGERLVPGVPAEVELSGGKVAAEWTSGKPVRLQNGGTIARELEGRQLAVTAGERTKLRSTGIELPPAAEGAPPTVYRPRLEAGGEPGSLVLAGSLERGTEKFDLGRLAARPAAGGGGMKIDWELRGIDRQQAALARIAEGLPLEPGLVKEVRYDARNRRLYLRTGEAAEDWMEISPGGRGNGPPQEPPKGPETKVGSPGDPDWFTVRRISGDGLKNVTAAAVASLEPRYIRVRPNEGSPGTTSRAVWLPPPAESPAWKITGGEIIYGGGEDLIVTSGPAHDLVRSLPAADLDLIKAVLTTERRMDAKVVELSLKDGAVTLVRNGDVLEVPRGEANGLLGPAKPGGSGLRAVFAIKGDEAKIQVRGAVLMVGGKTAEVTAQAREVARALHDRPWLIPYAAKLEHVDVAALQAIARVRQALATPPVLRATVENGQVVVRDERTGFDLRAAVRLANEEKPLPPQVKAFVGPGKAIDVKGLSARQLAGLRAQLRAIRKSEPEFTRLLDSGLEGSAKRRDELLDWEKIEVGVDKSIDKVQKHGEIAREILNELSGDLSDDRTIEFVVAHADEADTYFTQALRRAARGEFRGKHVAAAICELTPDQAFILRDAVLRNGGLSFINTDGIIDVPAATLAATRLRDNPGLIGAVTPGDVPRLIYEDAANALRQCLKEDAKVEAIEREFGRRAADFFRDDNGKLDNDAIERTRHALESDWLLFIETVDARELPHPAVSEELSRTRAA
jgi:hypothetical protein